MNHLYHVSSVRGQDFLLDSLKQSEKIIFQTYQRHSFDNGNFLIEIPSVVSKPKLVYISFFNHFLTESLLLELAFLTDAIKREYCCPIVCYVRYLEYSRSHRINKKNISYGAKIYNKLMCCLDIDKFFVFDLHAPELLGFFSKPVSQISSLPLFVHYYETLDTSFDYVIAPDSGRVDDCFYLSQRLHAKMDFFPKIRKNHIVFSEIATQNRIHLKGSKILLFDDEISSGQTLLHTIESLIKNEVSEIHIAIIYPFCSSKIFEKLESYPQVRSVTTTNLGTSFFFTKKREDFTCHCINCSSLFDFE